VGDVRGKGLMVAVELVSDRRSKAMLAPPHPFIGALVAAARHEGAIIRVQGNRLILSPPLVFGREHVDEMLRILHVAFEAAQRS
jgi:4-aminobutyrate aminotransferase-like enzyme